MLSPDMGTATPVRVRATSEGLTVAGLTTSLKVKYTESTGVRRGLTTIDWIAVSFGGVRSTMTRNVEKGEALPAASRAQARMRCRPSVRFSASEKDNPVTVASGSGVLVATS